MLNKLLLKDLGPYKHLIFAMMIGSLLGAGIGILAAMNAQAYYHQHQQPQAPCKCTCVCTKQ